MGRVLFTLPARVASLVRVLHGPGRMGRVLPTTIAYDRSQSIVLVVEGYSTIPQTYEL